jgi:hypothetical protein
MSTSFLPFISKKDDLLKRSEINNHKFLFAIDKPNSDHGQKEFNSTIDINEFIPLYQASPQKHFYEMVQNTWYEYYDLDLKIDPTTLRGDGLQPSLSNESYSSLDLFLWFDHIHSEFLNYTFQQHTKNLSPLESKESNIRNLNFISKTSWYITSASNDTKLSLHLINRNLLFNNNTLFKQFYSSFKSYIESFVNSSHPFFKAIDFSVSSNHRLMRLIHSSKINSDRHLKVFDEYHIEKVNDKLFFISDAINDPNIDKKLFTNDISKQLFLVQEKTISKYVNPVISEKDTNQLSDLLNLLNDSRADDYQDWLSIAFALKNSEQDYQLFDTFSKRSKKYNSKDCLHFWKSIEQKNTTNKPITLGTIHYFAKKDNPIKYNDYIQKYRQNNIDFPFTQDLTINSQYISENIYKEYLNSFDTLCIKSNMKTGKTFAMPSIFNQYQTVVVVYFRISLNKEIHSKWKQHGFEIYNEIKGDINLEEHPRIIIQVDSVHRLIGQCQLLILDEIESLESHLCSSEYIEKERCFNVLQNYIKYSNKLIVCDATLTDDTIEAFTSKRKGKLFKILNQYKSYNHITATNIHIKEELFRRIEDLLTNNKNIVIPTNSKAFCRKISKFIQNNFPNIKLLSIYKNEKYVPVEEWSNYNVITYTPTIVAGVSFDQTHFHTCIAYFTNNSCNASMSSQMLFRVRQLIDNNMVIYTPNASKGDCLPITNPEIERYINSKIKVGHSHFLKDGLNLDHFNEKVVNNSYYKVYRDHIRKSNISKCYFSDYITDILKQHGVKVINKFIDKNSFTDEDHQYFQSIVEELSTIKKDIASEDAEKIILAPILEPYQVKQLKDSKRELTVEEQLSIQRLNITTTFNTVLNHTPEDTQWIVENGRYTVGYGNYKRNLNNNMKENIEICNDNHIDEYDSKLIKKYEDFSYSSGDENTEKEISDEEEEKNLSMNAKRDRKIKLKKNVKRTIIQSIHYNSKWLKLKHCFGFLDAVGFTKLDQKEKIKMNWQRLLEYCRDNEEEIRTLFNSKRMDWNRDIEDRGVKQSLMQFVNNKLDPLLAVSIEATGHRCIYHNIKALFRLK